MDEARNGKKADARQAHARGRDTLWGLVLTFTIISSSQPARAQANSSVFEGSNLRVTLRMYNHGMSRGLLVHAETEAGAILNQAGIQAVWVDCPLKAAELEDYPACEEPMATTDFVIKVLNAGEADRFSRHHEALGQALECPRDQAGCSAYIFYRDVQAVARDGDASEFQVLGHALAHEIGHLLMGPNSHSAVGVMRGEWNHWDLKTIARAYLFFTEQQAKQIRYEVSARNAIRQNHIASAGRP